MPSQAGPNQRSHHDAAAIGRNCHHCRDRVRPDQQQPSGNQGQLLQSAQQNVGQHPSTPHDPGSRGHECQGRPRHGRLARHHRGLRHAQLPLPPLGAGRSTGSNVPPGSCQPQLPTTTADDACSYVQPTVCWWPIPSFSTGMSIQQAGYPTPGRTGRQ